MKTTDLKSLFWKEWHENIRWALLALLALSLGLTYTVLRQPSGPTLHQIWGDANLVVTLVVPLIGLALGLLQILPELRRDQWAFLVHRPAPRTTLFFGKVIPGVCLYLLATIPPLLGFAFWASVPSHVPAPFDFRFTLAGWAAILSGLPFYFAGLLTALRPARWYGSRALPVLSAVAGPWAANWLTEFWQAALVCLLIATVLLFAAWGSFITGGDYKEQTKPARFALGLTLYPAVMAVSVGLLILLAGAANLLTKPTGNGNEWWRTEYKIDTQGRIFETSEHGMDSAHQERKTLIVTDLAGHSVDPDVWNKLKQQGKLLTLQYLPVRAGVGSYREAYQHTERYVYPLSSGGSDTEFHSWYYTSRTRQIALYSVPKSGPVLVKYLGPNGFSENRRQAGQFPPGMPVRSGYAGLDLLQFPQSLVWFDLSRPAVGVLQDLQDSAGILGTIWSVENEDPAATHSPEAYFVATADKITVYGRASREAAPESTRRLFTIPLAFPGPNDIQVAATPDLSRFFFWYQGEKGEGKDHIVTIASDGRVLNTDTPPSSISNRVPDTTPLLINLVPAVVAPPVAVPVLTAFISIDHALNGASVANPWDSRTAYVWMFFFSCVGGLISATLTWRISLRCGDSRRGQILWAVGVFWLGLYGVLLLLALRAWPARIPCPNCKRLRVVDRELCEHCGAPFARPGRDGTEIFDEGEEAAVR